MRGIVSIEAALKISRVKLLSNSCQRGYNIPHWVTEEVADTDSVSVGEFGSLERERQESRKRQTDYVVVMVMPQKDRSVSLLVLLLWLMLAHINWVIASSLSHIYFTVHLMFSPNCHLGSQWPLCKHLHNLTLIWPVILRLYSKTILIAKVWKLPVSLVS